MSSRPRYIVERRGGGPWAIIGWMIVGGILAFVTLFLLVTCGLFAAASSL